MPYKLIFHPDTHPEIDKALKWYESISSDLGLVFESELIKCYERVSANPLHYFVLHKKLKIRRAVVKKFPYKLIFQLQKNKTILIVAVTSHKQRKYWKKRIK